MMSAELENFTLNYLEVIFCRKLIILKSSLLISVILWEYHKSTRQMLRAFLSMVAS